MSTVHHAYLYWSAMHRGPAYEFCCPYGTCESVLCRYGLHRTAMLFDRENGEKDQITCQWSCKNQRSRIKAYKRLSCTAGHYSVKWWMNTNSYF